MSPAQPLRFRAYDSARAAEERQGDVATGPTGRILGLAAYLADRRRSTVTLGMITADVPGYATTAPRDDRGELIAQGTEWERVRRLVRRDVDDLELNWGIEVDYDDDRRTYRLAPPFFTPGERRSLVTAAMVVDVAGLAETETLAELGGAVDHATQRVILSVPRRVLDLSEAIRARAPVSFRYHGRERTLDAYAIGRWHLHWYVVGHDHDANDRRVYRIDRIDAAESGAVVRQGAPGSYTVPQDFDAATELRLDPNDWGRDPHVVAQIRVDADHVLPVQHELGGRVVARDVDTVVVELDVRHYRSFRDRLLQFGERVVLLEPSELVEQIRDHLAAVAAGPG